MEDLGRHGGPEDRGSADRYYHRKYNPHYYKGATRLSKLIEEKDMTKEKIALYKKGWDEEIERKDYTIIRAH